MKVIDFFKKPGCPCCGRRTNLFRFENICLEEKICGRCGNRLSIYLSRLRVYQLRQKEARS